VKGAKKLDWFKGESETLRSVPVLGRNNSREAEHVRESLPLSQGRRVCVGGCPHSTSLGNHVRRNFLEILGESGYKTDDRKKAPAMWLKQSPYQQLSIVSTEHSATNGIALPQ